METTNENPIFNLKKAYLFHSEVETKQLRSFAIIFFIFFALILGIGPAIFHKASPRFWAILTGSIFLLFGLLSPKSLKSLYQAWMVFGGILGYINTRIILALVFFAILTPIAFIRRMMGKDALGLRFDFSAKTYRVPMEENSRFNMSRQF